MSGVGGKELLAIMAKAPRPGLSKTRLIPTLGAEGAALVAAAMLRDTVDVCTAVYGSRPDVEVAICFAPFDGEPDMRGLAPGVERFIPQRGDSLGNRLTAAFEDLFEGGASRAVVIGADSPTLPPAVVEQAFDRLEKGTEVVIGPTRDGGYYLIGMNAPMSALFVAVPWSTSRVLSVTLDRAAAKGLRVELLPEWYDIDEPVDLEHLESLFATGYDGAPATRAVLRDLRGVSHEPIDDGAV